jgi:hypothetical protein
MYVATRKIRNAGSPVASGIPPLNLTFRLDGTSCYEEDPSVRSENFHLGLS